MGSERWRRFLRAVMVVIDGPQTVRNRERLREMEARRVAKEGS